MTNDINGLNGANSYQTSLRNDKSNTDNSTDNPTSSSGSAEGSVKISQQARQLNDIQQTLLDTPEVDQNKVEAIRQSIENGQYEIDSQAIADKIIELDG